MDEIKDFLNYLLIDLKYSHNTIDTYRYTLTEFKKIIKINLKEVKEENIEYYIKKIHDKDDSNTINHHLNVLTSFYNYLLMEGLIKKNPIQNIEKLKRKKKLPKVLSKEEIIQILDVDLVSPYSYRDKAMLELMYSSGLRISELVSLKNVSIRFRFRNLKSNGKRKQRKNGSNWRGSHPLFNHLY